MYHALKQDSTLENIDLSESQVRIYDGKNNVSSRNSLLCDDIIKKNEIFEILKNDKPIGTFRFRYLSNTLEKLEGQKVLIKYTYDMCRNGEITSQEINN